MYHVSYQQHFERCATLSDTPIAHFMKIVLIVLGLCLVMFKLLYADIIGWAYIYVTGSTKTVLIAQDRKFDFFTQTQSLMNALSSFTATVDQSKVVYFCWLLF